VNENRQPEANIFQFERQGETIIVVPLAGLSELAYQEITAGAKDILELLDHGPARNVVLDFSRTAYYGSTALGFFVKLWKRVSKRNGRMAFCNVSDHEKETLQIMKLDDLWPICSSRREALAAVEKPWQRSESECPTAP